MEFLGRYSSSFLDNASISAFEVNTEVIIISGVDSWPRSSYISPNIRGVKRVELFLLWDGAIQYEFHINIFFVFSHSYFLILHVLIAHAFQNLILLYFNIIFIIFNGKSI